MTRACTLTLAGLILCGMGGVAASADEPLSLPEPDISDVKLDPASARRLEELRTTIRRRQRVAAGPEVAALYGELGMIYQAYQVDDAALTCYGNARTLDPGDFRWIYLAGVLHQRNNRLQQAEEALRETLRFSPGYAPALRRLGDVSLASNRLDEAEAFFSTVLSQLGYSPYSLEGLGQVALRRRDYRRAVELFERALQEAPEANRIHYALALAWRGLGDAQRARHHLGLRGERKPGAHDPLMVEVAAKGASAYTHFQRGLLAAREGDLETALGAFSQSVAQDPSNEDAQLALFDALRKLRRTEQAGARLDLILARFPDSSVAHYHKARWHADRGRAEEAIEHYRTALRHDPDYVRARYFLANSLMQTGEFTEAVPHFERLRADLPQELRVTYQLGLAHLAAEQCGQALAPLRSAYRANPRQYLVIVALARGAATCPDASSHDRELALKLARELHANRPSGETMETLAMALAATGRFREAAELQKQLTEQDPAPHLHANLALYRSGQPAGEPWPSDARVYRVPPPVAGDD